MNVKSVKHITLMIAAVTLGIGLGGCKRRAAQDTSPTEARETARADSASQMATEAARRRAADSAQAIAAEAARVKEVIEQKINFDFDKAVIGAGAQTVLNSKSDVLKANRTMRIRIAGHCDQRGTDAYNQALGLRRANAAKQYLVRAGIDAARIEVVSFGKTQLLDRANTRDARARNRRAEFAVLTPTGSP